MSGSSIVSAPEGASEGRTTQSEQIQDIEDLLERIVDLSEKSDDRISLDQILDVVGRRSFGPVLLAVGLVLFSPLSGIPGFPTATSIVVGLITGQILVGRKHFWLPDFLLRRSLPTERVRKAVDFVTPAAGWVDRVVRPRLRFAAEGPAVYPIAGVCLLVSLVTPFLEVLPFVASASGAGMTAFGLALIAHDGLLSIVAFTAFVGAGTALFVTLF